MHHFIFSRAVANSIALYLEIVFEQVSWSLTKFQNFQCSDWLNQLSLGLK